MTYHWFQPYSKRLTSKYLLKYIALRIMLNGAPKTSGFMDSRRLKMKLKCLAVIACMLPAMTHAAAIAEMPNRAGGKIVLTDEVCKHEGKTYESLARAYNYSAEGYTTEGCFAVEDETVVVIWKDGSANPRMRYPAENFRIIKKKSSGTRYGT
jgi:hypothetical protein